MSIFRTAVPLFLSLIVLCNSAYAADKIHLYAASSLYKPLQKLGAEFEKQTGVRVITVFASSSSLARQISQGAPADLFISADHKWIRYLESQQLIDQRFQREFLGNRVVLVSHKDNNFPEPIALEALFQQLSPSQRLATGNPEHVPLGQYAASTLQNMGLWHEIKPYLAPTRNARSALAMVERNETPLGISYYTDALNSDKVKIVAEFPSGIQPIIRYPIAILRTRDSASVRALYNYLFSASATAVFRQYGFLVEGQLNAQ